MRIQVTRSDLCWARTGRTWTIYEILRDRQLKPYHTVARLEDVEPALEEIVAQGIDATFSD